MKYSGAMSLFAELKRRRVFRVATAYLIAGWLFVEAASVGLAAFEAPAWALRSLILFVALGFPVALVLAWAFDVTPDGMRFSGRWRGDIGFYGFAGALGVAALVWFFWQPAYRGADDVPASEGSSIAVLAFENMSPDPANAYFAEGISEEVLNVLARIDGLTVASRTSAFSFKDTSAAIPEIARALNVAHVLEGSVRRQGNRVRITAQLIRADTDAHLWSATYDRDVVDIFEVQQEIGQAIADALQSVLGSRRVHVRRTTQDLEAYERFLRGRNRFYERRNLDGALADLQFAVQRDPDFIDAWSMLAAVASLAMGGGYHIVADPAEAATLAERAVARALELDPADAQAVAVQGLLLLRSTSVETLERGYELLVRAARVETHGSSARLWLGVQDLRFGYVDRALLSLEKAYAVDPLVGINIGYLGVGYMLAGRTAEGVRLARQAAETADWPMGAWMVTVALANSGEHAAAAALFRDSIPAATAAHPGVAAFIDALANPALRVAYLSDPPALPSGFQSPRLLAPLAFGDIEGVLATIDAAPDGGILMPILVMVWHPSMAWLQQDARFLAELRELGIIAYWERNGWPPSMTARP